MSKHGDHAILARLFALQKIRWEPFSNPKEGELCFEGLRHSTKLDKFGVPIITPHLINLIERAEEVSA